MTDGIVTNTIMPRLSAPDTVLGVVRVGYIVLQIGYKYKSTLLFFTCGYIKLKKKYLCPLNRLVPIASLGKLSQD